MKDIKTTLCTACKIYYEDIDYDDCPCCKLRKGNEKLYHQNTDLMNAIDDIAERQREACALAVERKSEKDTAYYACMQTPLVSEE